MRLWSIHPKYLDAKGLVALWREALLAQKVLEGKTRAYRKHPQLIRFRKENFPAKAISQYLYTICDEAKRRGYNFDLNKINHKRVKNFKKIQVTRGQINFECQHLKKKLRIRNKKYYAKLLARRAICANPVFRIIKGKKELWEKA